jgi:predicted permease
MRGWLEDLWRDLKVTVRGLRKRPTYAAVAVATLALGIGANAAIFTLVSAHFFTPLPYERPDELVLLWETGRNSDENTTVAPGNYFTWRETASSFVDVAAYNVSAVTLSGDAVAERVTSSVVVPHFFDVLGTPAQLGGTFREEAVRAADRRQVVISHSLWVRRYGSDPEIVGTDIRVNGSPYTVVGVMPASFRQPERSLSWQDAELWRPILLDGEEQDFRSRYLRTVARLRDGVSVEQARQEMSLTAARMAEAYPEANAGRSILVLPVDEYLLGDARPTLLMLLMAGFAVLVIVCANVANMTLARGQERAREFAVRAALGSGRTRLLRQVLVEGMLLAVTGAAVGVIVVLGAKDLLQGLQAQYFSGLVDVSVDGTVVGITAVVALATGMVFGLPVALAASRLDLRAALVEGGAGGGRGPRSARTRALLVVGQVALATTLLVVATLLSRSFNSLVNVPPGFEAEGRLTFDLAATARYEDREAVKGYFREVWRELEAIPGVTGLTMVSDMPFTTENRWTSLQIDGVPFDPTDPPQAEFHTVLPAYFDVMGIDLMAGTLPVDAWEPVEGEVPVAVNRRLAEAFWPGRDPLGATLTLDWDPSWTLRVAAVVANVLDDGYDAAPDPVFYLPYGAIPQRGMSVILRTEGDPATLIPAVRNAVSRVDPDIPAAELRPLQGMLAETVARPRAASLIGSVFAVIAVLVAAVGIYGVLSYAVQRRAREIAIRAALGASTRQLIGMVLGQSTRLVAVGLVFGLGGALLAGSALSGLLFGVRAWDPVSLAAASVLLGGVGTLAAWLPARRAVRVDPNTTLRAD